MSTQEVGLEMHELISALFPICRSITGNGVRETLSLLQNHIPLEIHEVPTGTQVFDWTVPNEWNIRDAWVKNAAGERVIDFRQNNLHVLNYSAPVHARLSLAELKQHLFSIPEHPDWVPYRTSYYAERWGFCLAHRELERLADGEYEVCIDSTLQPGALSYAECYLPGATSEEVLLSCHICHPSLANDNLAGIAVGTFAARALQGWSNRRYSYRLLLIPGTIGSITWLAGNEARARQIKHGLVLTCLGDNGCCTYKRSRRGTALIDRAALHVLQQKDREHKVVDFTPYGYDERQYCSPGFDLPVGCLMRTPNGQYPQYHTSADNLALVTPNALSDSLQTLLSILFVIENDRCYLNLNPKCEPQLGRRGLYSTMGGQSDRKTLEMMLLWVLNLSDGRASLLDIAERARTEFRLVKKAADLLEENGLLRRIDN